MSHIEEVRHCHNRLECQKDQLCDWVDSEMSKGCAHVSTAELGAAIDMIKDLSEAQKDIWKACYYKSVSEAMASNEEDMDIPHDRKDKIDKSHTDVQKKTIQPPGMRINQTLGTLREIWGNADPDLRKRMKADLTNLVNEMVI